MKYKLSEFIDFKGCYSANDVGNKTVDVDVEKLAEIIKNSYVGVLAKNHADAVHIYNGISRRIASRLPEIIKEVNNI